MHKKEMDELGRLSKSAFQNAQKMPIAVVLENVRSMHNVGSVFRTSDAFLVQKIYLCGYTPKPPHRDIQKTALGATETVAWEGVEEIGTCISNLKNNGYSIFAVEQVHGSTMLDQFIISNNQAIALVFGNEAEGVSTSTIALCDGSIEIPQFGSKHSFNISVSAGIVLWEIYKQLKTGK
ncbi:MAG: RNA methyltransferase [Chitinophagaceae bacterium]|jgi:tRNA G18 (ribose-2'-O)-methylase SpoU